MARPKNPALRARILDAAALEFAEKGFAGGQHGVASVALIGVTKGGVYFHFRSKEELFFAVLDEWTEGLRAALRGGLGPTAADQARVVLAVFLDYHFGNPQAAGLLRVLATEMRGRFTTQVREDLGGALRGLRARLRELLSAGARDGSLFATDPAQAAFLLAAGAEGVVQQWLASPRDVEPFCHAEALAEAMVTPYSTDVRRGPAPAREASQGEDLSPPF